MVLLKRTKKKKKKEEKKKNARGMHASYMRKTELSDITSMGRHTVTLSSCEACIYGEVRRGEEDGGSCRVEV